MVAMIHLLWAPWRLFLKDQNFNNKTTCVLYHFIITGVLPSTLEVKVASPFYAQPHGPHQTFVINNFFNIDFKYMYLILGIILKSTTPDFHSSSECSPRVTALPLNMSKS